MNVHQLSRLFRSHRNTPFFRLRTDFDQSLDTALMKKPLHVLLGPITQFPVEKRNDFCLIYSMILQEALYQNEISTVCLKARFITDDDARDHCFLIYPEKKDRRITIIDPTAGQFFSSDSFPHPFNSLIFSMNIDLSQYDFSQYCAYLPAHISPFEPHNHTLVEYLDLPHEAGVSIQGEYNVMLQKSRVIHPEEIVASLHRCLPEKATAEILEYFTMLSKEREAARVLD